MNSQLPGDEFRYLEDIHDGRCAALLQAWAAQHPEAGVLALVAEASRDQVPALQAAVRHTKLPLAGAIFPELMADGQFRRQGVVLIRFDHMPPHKLFSDLSGAGSEQPVPAQVSTLLDAGQPDVTDRAGLFMIFDGMVPNIGTLLEQIYYELADTVEYIGVNAGSETFQPMPCLFDNDHVLGNGLLAIVLPRAPGARLDHGYLAPEKVIMATSTDGNKITTIDWRPAFEVYQEIVAEQYGVAITQENFYQYGVHFPFGIQRLDGEYVVRIPVALADDGALFCVGEIPPNALLTLLAAVPVDSPTSVNRVAQLAADCQASTILGFYCAGRRLHLGDAAKDELLSWARALAPRALVGALSLGEIGSERQGGYPLFHNATLVAVPWS